MKFYKRIKHGGKWALEHRVVAEEILGRPLSAGEVVHHIDENKFNNHPSNLWIFRSQRHHQLYHGGADVYTCTDGVKECFIGSKYTCDCGSPKNRGDKRCYECHKRVLHENIPGVEDLIEAVLGCEYNLSCVGRRFGVSCNAVRKWLIKYGLPHKGLRSEKARSSFMLVRGTVNP